MNQIRAGDLVIVVKPTLCCGNASAVGEIFRVTEIRTPNDRAVHLCVHCDFKDFASSIALTGSFSDGLFTGFTVPRLKRIPPLEELERIATPNEISA